MFSGMKYSEGAVASEVREPRAVYVPIFDSFFESSIMYEDLPTRFVMLALIRLAWRPRSNGIVDVDPRLFAASINIPFADVEHAIGRLMAPDEDSGSKLEGGRRIVPLDPSWPMRGWRLVNWANYKVILHKANDKLRKAEERNRDKEDISDKMPTSPTIRYDTIRDDTKRKEKRERERASRFSPPSVEDVENYSRSKGYGIDADKFCAFYESKGWKIGTSPMKSWRAACLTWAKRDDSRRWDQVDNAPKRHTARRSVNTEGTAAVPTEDELARWMADGAVAAQRVVMERPSPPAPANPTDPPAVVPPRAS